MPIQPARIQKRKIEDFILQSVEAHPNDIKALTAQAFGLKRSAVDRHVARLCQMRLLERLPDAAGLRYRVQVFPRLQQSIQVVPGLAEDEIWRTVILPHLDGIAPNVLIICNYGCTEMLNNAIDHSGAEHVLVQIDRNATKLRFGIWDSGIGIFKKIQENCRLENRRHAVLELSKGKLTTDPQRHTGEGVFFTSRMFDRFTIMSGGLYFAHSQGGHDWLLEDDKDDTRGTYVVLEVDPRSERTDLEVFERFTAGRDDEVKDFSRTHFPVELAQVEGESLISRSQAKRLLARAEKFREVVLDFKGVKAIGPS